MQTPPPSTRTALLLWGVFVWTQLLITGISFAVPADAGDTDLAKLLPLLALVTAGVSVAAPFWVPRRAAAQTYFLLRWALGEAATILGFVSYLLSGVHTWQYLCLACGMLSILAAFPSAGAMAERDAGGA